jgi:hypothetical protein
LFVGFGSPCLGRLRRGGLIPLLDFFILRPVFLGILTALSAAATLDYSTASNLWKFICMEQACCALLLLYSTSSYAFT